MLFDRTILGHSNEFYIPRRRHAFTLVELLVVIGIIALLISMLLPALNRARQQANSIDCQARLRQMGQALAIYVVDNKGLLPYGCVSHPDANPSNPWTASTADAEPYWWWMFTLGQIMNRSMVGSDGMVHNLSPVFTDKDTINFGSNNNVNYVNHYSCNERVLWSTHDNDSLPGAPNGGINYSIRQRKMGSIRTSNVFVLFDAPQSQDLGSNSYPVDSELDGNELTFGHYFVLGSSTPGVIYARPVSPGGTVQTQVATICKAAQKQLNFDLTNYLSWKNQVRFRHLNNTSMNALCLDGHVTSRLVGAAMVTDFCTNSPY